VILYFRVRSLAAAVVFLSGCSDPCGNTVAKQISAPDGLHIATLFQRDCGATTGFSSQISILNAGEKLSGRGNTFVAENYGGARLGNWGGPWADMRWLATGHLLIQYVWKARVFTQKTWVSGVLVSYQRVH
jgi:hypothetical protein